MEDLIKALSGDKKYKKYTVKENKHKYTVVEFNDFTDNSIKELECDDFEVIKLAIISPTERFILKPKNKTTEELQKLFPESDFIGKLPFSEYKGRFLIERTMQDVMSGITIKELVKKKKLEILNTK